MWIILRVIIAIIFLTLLEYYFIRRTSNAVKQLFPNVKTKLLKICFWFFLIFINLFPVILISGFLYSAITNQAPSFPESTWLDYFLIYPFWFLFILVFQLAIYYLVFDLIKVLIFPLYKKQKEKFRKYESIIFLLLLIFFIIYVPVRIIYDYNSVDVNHITFDKDNLPADLNNFKIALISDIQADRYTDDKRLKNFIDKVNHEKPDLILIAGDLITSTPDYINKSAKYVGMLKSKYGVYSCVGDHDNWAYRQDTKRSVNEITDALRKYNVEMINDSTKIINVNNAAIGITFVTNTYVEKIPDNVLHDLINSNHTDLKILLTHQPGRDLIDAAVKNNYDMFFAGHTHGGQITLLFPFIQLTPTLVETSFIKGVRHYNQMLAVVSRGLGMSLAPIRYNSSPEIIIITLK